MFARTSSPSYTASSSAGNTTVAYESMKIDGLTITYREAGDPTSPKLLLLHGFPAAPHRYRNLIVALAPRFHVIAPDYQGFGNSEASDTATYHYLFDGIADTIDKLLVAKGFDRFGLTLRTASRLAFGS